MGGELFISFTVVGRVGLGWGCAGGVLGSVVASRLDRMGVFGVMVCRIGMIVIDVICILKRYRYEQTAQG